MFVRDECLSGITFCQGLLLLFVKDYILMFSEATEHSVISKSTIQNLTLLDVFLFPFSCVVAVREPRDRRRFRPDARETNGRPRTTKHVVRPAQRPRQHERGARGRRQSQWYVVVVLWRCCDCDVVVIVMLLGCDFRSITDQRLTRYFAFFLLDLFSVLCRH